MICTIIIYIICTIGYGNKSINNIKRALQDLRIDIIIDIRMRPYSRFNPQMNKKLLESIFGSKYLWVRELGGDLDIGSQDFKLKMAKIIDIVDKDKKSVMFMCCEKDFIRCHHLIITNYLEEIGFKKFEHLDIGDFD